jgi:cytoskeleton-associated protein 5
VYPYVYRILNARPKDEGISPSATEMRPPSPVQARPITPQSTRSSTFSSRARQNSTTSRTSTTHSTTHQPSGSGRSTPQQPSELELEEQLNTIWMKASAAENGAMHKDAINDLWNFIKSHPQMKSRVDAMIDGTGGVYMRYIRRALASRQAEDDLRSGGGSQSGTRTSSKFA